jgi:sulfatase maturation enzyme AslB (radical SAM superfamily)
MNNTLCVLPWIHLHPMPNGDVHPCCFNSRIQSKVGSLTTNTINEIANSNTMNIIRKNMLNDVPNDICGECIDIDINGGDSPRKMYNRGYQPLIEKLSSITNDDGSLIEPFIMKHLHIRHSNLCNFACRSCEGKYSSVINNNKIIKLKDVSNDYMSQIEPHLPHLKTMSITGGESILIEEHFEILDKLIALGKTDIKIFFTTNLSKLDYRGKSIIEYAEKLNKNNITIIASIDAIADRAEILRHGTKWELVEENLKKLIDSEINVMINCVVSAMNVWHAVDVEEYLVSKNYIKHEQFKITIMTSPIKMNMKLLPKDMKLSVTNKIKKYILDKGQEKKSFMTTQWKDVIDYMNSEDLSYCIKDFINYTNNLDVTRGESTLDAFPELYIVYKYYNEN